MSNQQMRGPKAPAALCRRCRRPLDTIEDYDHQGELERVRYTHTALDSPPVGQHVVVNAGRADHEPDPILRAEAIGSAVTVCDFCSAPGPRWIFGCRPFQYDGLNAGSADDWSACDTCHDLIEAVDWDNLAERGVDSMMFHSPNRVPASQRGWLINKVKGMHRQFAALRSGPPTLASEIDR